MRLQFWGTRGSLARPGPSAVRYGGNTSCVEIRPSWGTLIVIDCGTGANALGQSLLAANPKEVRGHILIGHTTWFKSCVGNASIDGARESSFCAHVVYGRWQLCRYILSDRYTRSRAQRSVDKSSGGSSGTGSARIGAAEFSGGRGETERWYRGLMPPATITSEMRVARAQSPGHACLQRGSKIQ
jgi:hypothetical protein